MGGGEFVLDEKRALAKLQKFQLPSPHHYLLEFVKAAHLLGAEQINFRITIDEVEVAFDGEALRPEELEIFYSAPFSQRGEGSLRALRHLAIGANAARGLGLREFIIDIAGDEPHGVCVVGDEISRRSVELEQEVAWTTRLYLRRRMQWSKLKRFVNQAMGTRGEVDLLRERCRYSSVDIRVNEERVSHGMTLSDNARSIVKITGPAEEGRLGIYLASRQFQTVVLQHGVLINSGKRHSNFWGAEAVVDSGRLTTNLSQSAFVEDHNWNQLHEILETAKIRSLSIYVRDLAIAVQEGDQRADVPTQPFLDSLLHLLRSLNAGDLIEGRFDELIETLNQRGSSQSTSGPRAGNDASDEHSPERHWRTLQLTKEAIQDELERLNETRRNIKRWQASPAATALNETSFPFQKTEVLNNGSTITAAISPTREISELHLIHEGNLLEVRRLETGGCTGITLRASGTLPVCDRFERVLPSRTLHGLVSLVELLFEVIDDAFYELDQEWQLSFVEEMISGDFRDTLQEAMGWARWPVALQDKVPNTLALPITGTADRLAMIRKARAVRFFEGAHNDTWSLSGLWKNRTGTGLDFLAVATPDCEDLLDDERLQGHPVLRVDNRRRAILEKFLDHEFLPVAQYLERLEIAEQKKEEENTGDFDDWFEERPRFSQHLAPTTSTSGAGVQRNNHELDSLRNSARNFRKSMSSRSTPRTITSTASSFILDRWAVEEESADSNEFEFPRSRDLHPREKKDSEPVGFLEEPQAEELQVEEPKIEENIEEPQEESEGSEKAEQFLETLRSSLEQYSAKGLSRSQLSLRNLGPDKSVMEASLFSTWLNEDHPVIEYAMENQEDPIALAFVLRALHAAVHLNDIEDQKALDHKLAATLDPHRGEFHAPLK